jgi:hypothetical protein
MKRKIFLFNILIVGILIVFYLFSRFAHLLFSNVILILLYVFTGLSLISYAVYKWNEK